MASNLGKRREVGETFRTTTKSMTKDRGKYGCRLNKELNGSRITYEVLRPSDKRYFTKGKRRYFCEVVAMVEMKTGFHAAYVAGDSFLKGSRWWQFTYLVKVLEN